MDVHVYVVLLVPSLLHLERVLGPREDALGAISKGHTALIRPGVVFLRRRSDVGRKNGIFPTRLVKHNTDCVVCGDLPRILELDLIFYVFVNLKLNSNSSLTPVEADVLH